MKQNDLLADDVDFDSLAARTKNYTGAEIEAVCRGATSFALFKDLDLSNLGKEEAKNSKTSKASISINSKGGKANEPLKGDKKVTMADFEQALEENKPAFGVDNDNLQTCIRGGIYPYGEAFNELYKVGMNFITEIKNSKSTPLLSILLEGKNGSGKTALAAKLALQSRFPYVKMITPENFVGYSEQGKISQIVKVFEDAYKSPLSLIILDDLERLIEFIHIGPRFSNPILQALLVLIKKKPTNADRKLMIIGTTSMKQILQEMELVDCFNVCQHVPSVRLKQEVAAVMNQYKGSSEEVRKISNELAKDNPEGGFIGRDGIPIKNLLLSIELAIESSSTGALEFKSFMDAFRSVNHDY
jgi:vesicle-fusing ATPase